VLTLFANKNKMKTEIIIKLFLFNRVFYAVNIIEYIRRICIERTVLLKNLKI